MASRYQINDFIKYCLENKSFVELKDEFYQSLGVNHKECLQYGLNNDEWRYAIRMALKKKRSNHAKKKES